MDTSRAIILIVFLVLCFVAGPIAAQDTEGRPRVGVARLDTDAGARLEAAADSI